MANSTNLIIHRHHVGNLQEYQEQYQIPIILDHTPIVPHVMRNQLQVKHQQTRRRQQTRRLQLLQKHQQTRQLQLLQKHQQTLRHQLRHQLNHMISINSKIVVTQQTFLEFKMCPVL